MNVLIENASNRFDNHGDTAMLVVTHDRLRKLWPDAAIEVTTAQPDQLAAHCPGAIPVDVHYPQSWRRVYAILKNRAPLWIDRWTSMLETEMRLHWPFRWRDALLEALARADVVVHSGAGVINDEFVPNAIQRLDLMRKAVRAGKATAMFSQGIGPISHARLASKAAQVLPAVNLIAVRERVGSYPILRGLGVDPNRIVTTGDDAIAFAHTRRRMKLGGDLGVNIRLARYSGLSSHDRELLDSLHETLVNAADSHRAALVSIVTSKDDRKSLRSMITEDARHSSAAREEKPLSKVHASVNRCRVVVAGSYHAAVFALSQGIPAICLVRSSYYAQKFLGLADQFGEGCQVLILDGQRMEQQLMAMIDQSWERAPGIRSQLLDAARRQIEASLAAYQRFSDLIGGELQTASVF